MLRKRIMTTSRIGLKPALVWKPKAFPEPKQQQQRRRRRRCSPSPYSDKKHSFSHFRSLRCYRTGSWWGAQQWTASLSDSYSSLISHSSASYYSSSMMLMRRRGYAAMRFGVRCEAENPRSSSTGKRSSSTQVVPLHLKIPPTRTNSPCGRYVHTPDPCLLYTSDAADE